MNKYTLYMHVFPNGKRYIGITCVSVFQRWKEGKGYIKQPVYNAICKYGWDNIEHKILQTNLSKEQAEMQERLFISKYKTINRKHGYNIEKGGYHNGTTSEETKIKISNSCKGKKHKYQKRIYKNRNKNAIPKQVICIETGEIFPCAKYVQLLMGIDANNIKHCCNHYKNYKTAGGYHWEFV